MTAVTGPEMSHGERGIMGLQCPGFWAMKSELQPWIAKGPRASGMIRLRV